MFAIIIVILLLLGWSVVVGMNQFAFLVLAGLIIYAGLTLAKHTSVKIYIPTGGLPAIQATFTNVFVALALMAFLWALGERVLYDIGRWATVGGSIRFEDYFTNLTVIMAHAAFILPLVVILVVINVWAAGKAEHYALVLLPYYVVTIFMAVQLALQVSSYFYWHHTDLQFYLAMTGLVLISSFAIYWIQSRLVSDDDMEAA